jgi:hypothetical protein
MPSMIRVASLLLVAVLAIACKKNEPSPADAAPATPGEQPKGLAEQDIKRVIKENRPAMEKCYDAAAAEKPGMEGKITLVFAVNPDGSVDKKRAGLGGDVGGEAFAKCVLDVVVGLQFPGAPAGTDVQMPLDLRKRADAGVEAPKPDAKGD